MRLSYNICKTALYICSVSVSILISLMLLIMQHWIHATFTFRIGFEEFSVIVVYMWGGELNFFMLSKQIFSDNDSETMLLEDF